MTFSSSLAVSMLGFGLLCAIGACGSTEPAEDGDDSADQAAVPPQVMMNDAPAAGHAGGAVSDMQPAPAAAPGTGGMAGQAGGAGSGGAASMAAGGAAAAGMGGADAADASVEDDFFGVFAAPEPDALSCEGLICLESADCTSLYPDEAAACHFTTCEDFICK